MNEIFLFLKNYNQLFAVGTFAVLTISFIIVMILSEWKRGENWWR